VACAAPEVGAAQAPELLEHEAVNDTKDDDELRWSDAKPRDDACSGCGLDWFAGTNNTRDLRIHKISQVMSGLRVSTGKPLAGSAIRPLSKTWCSDRVSKRRALIRE